ncbi:hypothetical protein D3C85_1160940 [compost metagenome]
MRVNNSFQGICDNLTAWQGIAHSDMTHCNPIVNPDCVELEWNAACFANGFFNNFTEFLQMNMSRNNVYIRVTNRNKRLAEIFLFNAGCTQQAAMWSAVETFFDHVTALFDLCHSLFLLEFISVMKTMKLSYHTSRKISPFSVITHQRT